MKCTVKEFELKKRLKSIGMECLNWALLTSQLAVCTALICIQFDAKFVIYELVGTCGIFAATMLWLLSIGKHPHLSGDCNRPYLESDEQIQERNTRHLHDFLMKFTPVLAIVIIISLCLMIHFAVRWIVQLGIVGAVMSIL